MKCLLASIVGLATLATSVAARADDGMSGAMWTLPAASAPTDDDRPATPAEQARAIAERRAAKLELVIVGAVVASLTTPLVIGGLVYAGRTHTEITCRPRGCSTDDQGHGVALDIAAGGGGGVALGLGLIGLGFALPAPPGAGITDPRVAIRPRSIAVEGSF